jgi:hypothetical protein
MSLKLDVWKAVRGIFTRIVWTDINNSSSLRVLLQALKQRNTSSL